MNQIFVYFRLPRPSGRSEDENLEAVIVEVGVFLVAQILLQYFMVSLQERICAHTVELEKYFVTFRIHITRSS